MLRRPVLVPCLCACAAGLALAFPAAPASAVELPTDGNAKLQKQYNEAHPRLNDLVNGKAEATKDDKGAIDTLAKWYAYRLTWNENENKPNQMNGVMLELESEMGRADRGRPATNTFLEMFTHQLIENAMQVLKHPQVDPIAKVNAARILWRVATAGNQEVVDACVDLIKDASQNEGTRYWAFRTLQEVFAPKSHMPPVVLQDPKRQQRCIAALNEYVAKKLPVTADMSPANVEGLRVLRREAVHALALTSYPAVVADPKTKKIQSETALTLAKSVAGVGMVPEPRWDERLEAAIGLCWMQPKLYPNYQPDYAGWFVGNAVSLLGKAAAEAAGAEDTKNTNRGWKYYSARLGEALDNLERETKANYKQDRAVVAYVDELYKQCADVLKAIDNGATINVSNLNDWLQNHAPPSETIYKGVPDARVKFAAEPAAEK